MNNNSNGKDSVRKKPSQERTRQEAMVLQDFFRASQRQLEILRQQIGMTSGSIAAQELLNLSDREKEVLRSIHGAGMMEGIFAGIVTFVLLRRIPKYLERRAARSFQQPRGQEVGENAGVRGGSSGYTLDTPSKVNSPFRTGNSGNGHGNTVGRGTNSGQEEAQIGERGLVWRSVSFLADTALSFLVAAYTTAYMADTEKIKTSVTEIPLMEGRSAISNKFCPALLEEYKRQWNMDPSALNQSYFNGQAVNAKNPIPPFDRKDVLKDPNIGLLKAYIEFIENCQKRKIVEDRIREERGLGPMVPVEIPAPGISKSDEEWINKNTSGSGLFGIEASSEEDSMVFLYEFNVGL